MSKKSHLDRCIEIEQRFIGRLNRIYTEACKYHQSYSYILDSIQQDVNEPLNALKRVPRWVHASVNAASQALLAHVFNVQLVWCHRSPNGKLYTTHKLALSIYQNLYLNSNIYIFGTDSLRIPNACEELNRQTGGWISNHYWIGTDKVFN